MESLLSHETVPEVLAPAGGRAQFFAALHSGADAVYLGLKEFNARGRAENFTIEDLQELAPIARRFGMKILVTLNILLKEHEFPRLVEDLLALQWIGIHAVIVQDLGVARFIRERFPTIRLHASTQLAVHNLAGVEAAAAFGFKRVVLARELTAQEIRRIRNAIGSRVEIEAFCHGSLCYSYSGLCFFSGAEDARSGNRGECAYTCRKPYKIVNEPGHGFLFSMKDLNTSKDLNKLVDAGVDTLKIEGRKKDAQYVATSVGLYRQELNRLFGRETGPQGRSIVRDYGHDMAFSFHRDSTSFFVNGRYHENVIDLNNPTHKGLLIGQIEKISGRSVELLTKEALERFDGIRIDRGAEPVYHAKPQHGEEVAAGLENAKRRYQNENCQFSLRDFSLKGRRLNECAANTRITIDLPPEVPLPRVGDPVYKIRSNELKRHTENLTNLPPDVRLRPLRQIQLSLIVTQVGEESRLRAVASLGSEVLADESLLSPWQLPQKASTLEQDLQDTFALFGDIGLECELQVTLSERVFIPRKSLKELKQRLGTLLPPSMDALDRRVKADSLKALKAEREPLESNRSTRFHIKFDRLEYLPAIASEVAAGLPLAEIIFEPKRAFLGKRDAAEIFDPLFAFASTHGLQLRLALPTVLRAWDEPLLKLWIRAFQERGGLAYEVGNIGAIEILRTLGISNADLSSDFTFYALNTEAVLAAKELGVNGVALSVEDDRINIEEKLRNWPRSGPAPLAILYKDTPLFIAEACSLTALHQGCPTAAVCGYRTLEIENDEGERFFVAHESCKSIVYAARPYATLEHREGLEKLGVADFRLDFLTRPYSEDDLRGILRQALQSQRVADGHSANFERQLL